MVRLKLIVTVEHWSSISYPGYVCGAETVLQVENYFVKPLQWGACQHSLWQHSLVPVLCGNTLTNVCCNSICSRCTRDNCNCFQSLTQMVGHRKQSIKNFTDIPDDDLDDDDDDFQWRGRRHGDGVWQENSGQSFHWQLAPPRPFSCKCQSPFPMQSSILLTVFLTFNKEISFRKKISIFQAEKRKYLLVLIMSKWGVRSDPIWFNFLLLPFLWCEK